MWSDHVRNSCNHQRVTAETSDPAARLLRLLALLYSRPRWSGEELAHLLGVSARTLRRDVERLQRLEYQVRSRPGPGGHYSLGAGARLPPLLFDDDEVLALVAALRMIEDRVDGDAATRALTKLLQVLPRRLRSIARDVAAGTESVQRRPPDLNLDMLSTLTQAAVAERSVEFEYRDQSARSSLRHVDSLRCVHSRGQWYLVGFDTDRDAWRLFRIDGIGHLRLGDRTPTARDGHGDDLATWLTTDFGRATSPAPEVDHDHQHPQSELPLQC
jgi:predicted DNA-binding transcriptional regulator YafY